MKLCYRGVSYDYKTSSLKMYPVNDAVKYRGRTYKRNAVVLNCNQHDQEEMVYRGVRISCSDTIYSESKRHTDQLTKLGS